MTAVVAIVAGQHSLTAVAIATPENDNNTATESISGFGVRAFGRTDQGRHGKNLTAIAFVLTLLTTGLFSSPLMAQMPGPGVNDYVDSNGVDLISLHFNWSTTELSIGQPDAGGLSYIRSIQGYGWTDNFSGTIYKSGSTYKIAFGRNAETFTEAGGFFIPAQGQGSALRYESGTDTYVFTSVNGVVSTFKITANFIGYSTGHVLSTVYPSGDQLTYHYVEAVAEACPPTQCTAWVNLRRLQAVTNNLGYQIRFNYAANGFMLDYEQTTDWQTRTGAVALNMAVDYCDPEGSSCPAFTVNWPAVTYAASNGIETVTDVMGRVTRYLFGPTSIGIRRPSSPNSNSITVTVESATILLSRKSRLRSPSGIIRASTMATIVRQRSLIGWGTRG